MKEETELRFNRYFKSLANQIRRREISRTRIRSDNVTELDFKCRYEPQTVDEYIDSQCPPLDETEADPDAKQIKFSQWFAIQTRAKQEEVIAKYRTEVADSFRIAQWDIQRMEQIMNDPGDLVPSPNSPEDYP